MNERKSYDTTIWTYLASNINWQIKNEIWDNKKWGLFEKNIYRLSDGHKMMLIVSMAGVIEGAMKSFLSSYVLDNVPSEDTRTELLEKIESSPWGNSMGNFNTIFFPLKFKTEIKKYDVNLFDAISILFKYRNHLVHANTIKFSTNSEVTEFSMDGKTEPIYEYMNDKGLTIEDPIGKSLMEIFVTDKAVIHFQSVMNDFIKFLEKHRNVPSFKHLITHVFFE